MYDTFLYQLYFLYSGLTERRVIFASCPYKFQQTYHRVKSVGYYHKTLHRLYGLSLLSKNYSLVIIYFLHISWLVLIILLQGLHENLSALFLNPSFPAPKISFAPEKIHYYAI